MNVRWEGHSSDTWQEGFACLSRQVAQFGSAEDPVVVRPVRDPTGATAPLYFECGNRAGWVARAVVIDDRVLGPLAIRPPNGRDAAVEYFSRIGFPETCQLSWHLLCDLLHQFGVVGSRWYIYDPRRWQTCEESYRGRGLPLPAVRYRDRRTVLRVFHIDQPWQYRTARASAGASIRVKVRRELAFDSTGIAGDEVAEQSMAWLQAAASGSPLPTVRPGSDELVTEWRPIPPYADEGP
jgi:hypothetical protein